MQRMVIVATAVVLLATPTLAQEPAEGAQRVGTVFGSLGGISDGTSALFHIGGGEEVVWPNGFGVGADVGYISSTNAFGEGLFLLTAGPLYEFRNSSRYRPFVRGGVSLAIGQGGALPLMHIGGGLNQWFDEPARTRSARHDPKVLIRDKPGSSGMTPGCDSRGRNDLRGSADIIVVQHF